MAYKSYLGDSVYAELDFDRGMVKLTTENGFGPSNTIWMEPDVLDALVAWYARVTSRPAPPAPAESHGEA